MPRFANGREMPWPRWNLYSLDIVDVGRESVHKFGQNVSV